MNWWAIIGVAILVIGYVVVGAADIVRKECGHNEEDH